MSKQFRHGLVIGKFYPLHTGHVALLTAALARCDRVTVEVLGSATESFDVQTRAEWVRRTVPATRVVATEDEAEIDFDSETAWQHHTAKIAGLLDPDDPVDVLLSSDTYGQELARRLGVAWHQVDPGRESNPARGTDIRADVARNWWALPAAVRGRLARRVVVLGAESTGTTTLARQLAEHYRTSWVPDFAHEWTQRRPGGLQSPWHPAEFDLIAAEHARQEDDAAEQVALPLVFCDTDVLATGIWHERYLGQTSSTVTALAARRVPDLYLLTGLDVPFVDDGLRDGEHLREWMHGRFVEVLAAQPAPCVTVTGDESQRLEHAVREVDALLSRGWSLAPSLEEQQRARAAFAARDASVGW